MKTINPLIALRRKAGLAPVVAMSAKQLRLANPELADKWAKFIQENKAMIVGHVSGLVLK